MGFLDFFRKKKKENEFGESEERAKKIDFDNLNSWFTKKKEEIHEKEKEFASLVKKRILQLINELEEEIVALENIDLSKKKEYENVKIIVKENLNNYIIALRKLVADLSKLEDKINIIGKIDLAIYNFFSKSSLSFHKATYLVGNELGNVKNSMSSFARDVKNIEKENLDLIKSVSHFFEIGKKIGEISKTKEIEKVLLEKIDQLDLDIKNIELLIENMSKEVKIIINSEEYIKSRQTEEEIKIKRGELDKEISELRSMINFKSLARIFHTNEKKMNILKECKDNFKEFFYLDDGDSLIQLINDDPNNEILIRINKVVEKKREIDKIKINDDKAINLLNEIKYLKMKIGQINEEKEREKKRLDKITGTIKEIENEVSKICLVN